MKQALFLKEDAEWLQRELAWQIQRNEALLLTSRSPVQTLEITEEIDRQSRILGALKS